MLDSVTITFDNGDTAITLTNVHRHYFRFGYRMGIYATPNSTITFNSVNTPYVHGHGRLTSRTPYNLYQFTEAIGGSAVSFNMGWCSTTGTIVFPYYMDLIGGVYPWVAQLMFFMHPTFDDHVAAMHRYGYSSLLMHMLRPNPPEPLPPNVHPTEDAPIIPGITIRPPDLAPGDNLTVTFTNVYDAIGAADITMQSARWFYVAPNASVSFNRDMELRSFNPTTAKHESISTYPLVKDFMYMDTRTLLSTGYTTK